MAANFEGVHDMANNAILLPIGNTVALSETSPDLPSSFRLSQPADTRDQSAEAIVGSSLANSSLPMIPPMAPTTPEPDSFQDRHILLVRIFLLESEIQTLRTRLRGLRAGAVR
jgi:hypothetical protein